MCVFLFVFVCVCVCFCLCLCVCVCVCVCEGVRMNNSNSEPSKQTPRNLVYALSSQSPQGSSTVVCPALQVHAPIVLLLTARN